MVFLDLLVKLVALKTYGKPRNKIRTWCDFRLTGHTLVFLFGSTLDTSVFITQQVDQWIITGRPTDFRINCLNCEFLLTKRLNCEFYWVILLFGFCYSKENLLLWSCAAFPLDYQMRDSHAHFFVIEYICSLMEKRLLKTIIRRVLFAVYEIPRVVFEQLYVC
jgi:hypothetical protein